MAVARSNGGRAKADASRLFIVDADLDPRALRARHPDCGGVAIAPAQAREGRSSDVQRDRFPYPVAFRRKPG